MTPVFARLIALMAALACALPASFAFAGTATALTLPAQSHPGSRERQFKVYVPTGGAEQRRW